MQKEKEVLNAILGENSSIIAPIMGGMMNRSFVVEQNNKKYVLYISTEQANEMVNRRIEKDNQRKIASLGLTSKNYYFDIENGIKLNEYIEGSSLDKVDTYEPQKVAKLLKTMHESGLLAENDYQPFNRLVDYKKEALSLAKLDDEFYELESVILENKSFLESQKKVIAHNDAQKSNIVKSYNNEYFLIDFEFMGNNDPLYDIACFGNGEVKEGRELLDYYFDKPNEEQIRRYYLWRIFVSLQWYLVAIIKHYKGEGKIHNFDFLAVAKHFMDNAKEAYRNLK